MQNSRRGLEAPSEAPLQLVQLIQFHLQKFRWTIPVLLILLLSDSNLFRVIVVVEEVVVLEIAVESSSSSESGLNLGQRTWVPV